MRTMVTFKGLKARGHPFTRRHTERLVKDGKFPPPVQVGENRIAWFEDEVDAHYARLAAERSPQPEDV